MTVGARNDGDLVHEHTYHASQRTQRKESNGDLALWPNSRAQLGFGLWHALPIGSWVLEGLFAACIIAYCVRQRVRGAGSMLGPSIVLIVLFVQLSPWLSPMKLVARLSPHAATVTYGVLVTLGFLIPSLIITAMLNRSTKKPTANPISKSTKARKAY